MHAVLTCEEGGTSSLVAAMKTSVRSALASLVALVLASCASGGAGGGNGDFDSYSVSYRADARGYRYTFASSTDRVVEALPEAYGYLGFPGNLATNSDELLFISPSATAEGRIYDDAPNSSYLDCGRGVGATARADSHIVQFALVTKIVSLETGGSEIEVIIDGRARERAHNMNAIPCQGTGKLEAELAAVLRTMLTE